MFLGCQPCCNADCPREELTLFLSPITDVTDAPPAGGWDVQDDAARRTFYVRRLSGAFSQTPSFATRGLTFTGCDNFDAWRAGYRYTHARMRYRHRSSTFDSAEQPAFDPSRVAEGAGAAFRLMAHYEHETGDHVFMQLDHELLARGKGRLRPANLGVEPWRYVVDSMTEYTEVGNFTPGEDATTITPTGLNSLSTYPIVIALSYDNGWVWAAEHTACHWKVGYVINGVETVVDEWLVYGAGDYVLELGVVGNVCTYNAHKTVRFLAGFNGPQEWGQSFTAVRGQSQGQVIDNYHINPATEVAAAFIVPEPLASRDYGSIGFGARPTQYNPPGGLAASNFLGLVQGGRIVGEVGADIVTFPEVTTPVIGSGIGFSTNTSSLFGNIRTTLFRLPCEPGWQEANAGYVGTTLTADDRASPQRLCRVEVRDRVPGKPVIDFFFHTFLAPARAMRYDPHQIGGTQPGILPSQGVRCQQLASVTLNRKPPAGVGGNAATLAQAVAGWQASASFPEAWLVTNALVDSLPITESVQRVADTYYHYRKDITPAASVTYQYQRTLPGSFVSENLTTTITITIEWLYFYWENYRERSVARHTVTNHIVSDFFGTETRGTAISYVVNYGNTGYPYLEAVGGDLFFDTVNVYV